jgi:hypothetical protein
VTEAAPQPILGTLDQTTTDGIAVHVAQFLNSLVLAPDVEVVVAGQPEGAAFRRAELTRRILLEHLQNLGESSALRFADEQKNVLGHYYISADEESVPLANLLQSVLEDIAGVRSGQEGSRW